MSDFTRRQLCSSYSIAEDRVHSIPNGVDFARFAPGSDGSDVVSALRLNSGSYFLTVGRLEPRKNHANLLRAWAKLPNPRPRLVIVGQKHFGYSEIFDLMDELRLKEDVLLLEQITDAHLPALYRHARAFIYCSWAEGFGIPVLEAMASGVPVISSPNTALIEVGGDAVLWADPGIPEEIAKAVIAIDQGEELRQTVARRGLMQARRFTWEQSAATTVRAYRNYFGLS